MCAAAQLFNNYVAKLTQGQHISAARVTFWLIDGDSLSRVDAELPAYGSLGPLFHAFGLISAEELKNGAGSYISGTPTAHSFRLIAYPHCGRDQQLISIHS